MLRLYEDGSLGDSNGRIYAIAANVGQAPPALAPKPFEGKSETDIKGVFDSGEGLSCRL